MEKINLFGASGHAKVIAEIICAQGNVVGCMYDDAPHCSEIHGISVYNASKSTVEGPLIISIGANRDRKAVSRRYMLPYSKALHPNAIISPTASIGEGSVIMPGAIIQSETSVGRHCIINTGASVDHECHIDDYVHIAPQATLCGNIYVGEGSSIGAGSIIVPGVKIGRWCTIGAGAVVIRDIPDGATAFGNPAKIKS